MADISLEQQIMDEVRKLTREQQAQVLRYILSITPVDFSFEEWLKGVEAFQEDLRSKYGDDYKVGSIDLLEEAREERLDDIMGGS